MSSSQTIRSVGLSLATAILAMLSVAGPVHASNPSWVVSGAAPEPAAANCVDRCIARYALAMGRSLPPGRLREAIGQLGLDQDAKFRSLQECRELLKILELPARAIPFKVGKATTYPPACILYLPPDLGSSVPGHVILITSVDGRQLRIYDPAARVPETEGRADSAILGIETIAIVPEESFIKYAAVELGGMLGLSLLIGLGIAGVVVFFTRRKTPGPSPSVPAAALLGLLALGATGSLFGCSSPAAPSTGVVIPDEDHDFGVIPGETRTVTHTFRIENHSPAPIRVMPMASSCSCVIVDNLHSGLKIAPGSSEPVTVTIQLAQKTGPFRESVTLNLDPQEAAKPTRLNLKGFVSRGPVVSSISLKFEALDGQKQTEELEVVYTRVGEDDPAEFAGVIIEGPDAASFEVATPEHRIGNTSASSVADVWKLLVSYRAGRTSAGHQATVRLKFRKPQTELMVSLVGRKLGSVEPLGTKAPYLSSLKVGEVHQHKIYLRFYDKTITDGLSIQADASKVWGTVDVESRLIRLSVRPDQAGEFSYPVRLMHHGVSLCAIDVNGSAR